MGATESYKPNKNKRLGAALVIAVKGSWGEATPHYYLSKNISENGVFVIDKHPPEIDTKLKMEFVLPTYGINVTRRGELFYGWVEGRVVRVGEVGYAVQFEDEFHLSLPT